MFKCMFRSIPFLYILVTLTACGGGSSSGEHAVCGDGIRQGSEVCDDNSGNCNADCSSKAFEIHTAVSSSTVLPEEAVTVSCEVYDAYGNILESESTDFSVIVQDGTGAVDAGLQLNPNSFTATHAGIYEVTCSTPDSGLSDASPEMVELIAGLPFRWSVTKPATVCFNPLSGLPLTIKVFDRWDNVLQPPGFVLNSTPAGASIDLTGLVTVPAEGAYDLELLLTGEFSAGHTISPYTLLNARFDSSPPVITLDAPALGAQLLIPDTIITIAGSVTDTVNPISSLTVNGSPQPLSGSSSEVFNFNIFGRWGHNIILANATDSCGNTSNSVRSVLVSNGYYAAATNPNVSSRINDAVLFRLNSIALDDGIRADSNDLATLMEKGGLSTSNLDIGTPDLLFDNVSTVCYDCVFFTDCNKKGFQILKSGAISHDAPAVLSLQPVDEGLHSLVEYPNVTVPVRISAWENYACAGDLSTTIDGTVTFTNISATTILSTGLQGGSPTSNICSTCNTISPTGELVNVNWGLLSFYTDVDQISTMLTNTVNLLIDTSVDTQTRQHIPSAVDSFYAAIKLPATITMPPPISPTPLQVASIPSSLMHLGPTDTGYGKLGLGIQIYASGIGSNIPPASFGTIKRPGVMQPLFPYTSFKTGIALHDDFINQVLWANWYGGSYDLQDIEQLASISGFPGITGSMRLLAPPVWMPSSTNGLVDIGVGDIALDIAVDVGVLLGTSSSDITTIEMRASMQWSGTIASTLTSRIDLTVAVPPTAHIEIVSAGNRIHAEAISNRLTEFVKTVWPILISDSVKSITLPYVDTGYFLPGNTLTLQDTTAVRDNSNNYTIFTGQLR